MNLEVLISQQVNASEAQFWKAIEIYLNNPHLINRRVLSSVTLYKGQLKNTLNNLITLITCTNASYFIAEDNTIQNLFDETNVLPDDSNPFENKNGIFLYVRKLFPRNDKDFDTSLEFSIVNKDEKSLTCISKKLNKDKRLLGLIWPYKIIYNDEKVIVEIENLKDNIIDSGVEWIKEKLFPRLIKWIESDPKTPSFVEGSLNLVSSEKYTNLYSNLKKKYGIELVKKWPECTDPAKFVYEDVAIATYLLLLWEKERNNDETLAKQSFVDLGCGNGLLVFILTSEGHPGFGIDLRKRKIWDLFSGTSLQETTIVPSSKSLFPDIDWIIGNHSDELTPWIPVIAARSSYKCRFFLLPCCAHEFDGRKFQRPSAGNSQYLEYLKYIKSVCEGCGFITQLDKLRIPSTKRTCLIGETRNYPEEKTNEQDDKIECIINARAVKKLNDKKINEKSDDKWSKDFKPRDVVERVRNCTQIDRNIVNEIVDLVKTELLVKKNLINREFDDKKWNAGGQLELNKIAKIVPSDLLKKLKNECGGLQTLLKNHSHIFQVRSGIVQFKIPGCEDNFNKNNNKRGKHNSILKTKLCWFFNNHPDGCLASDEKCKFIH